MSDQWIFGYGSLVWRPAFAFEQRSPAYITGWKRRFWQESTDHRGTVDNPGRVVTLLPSPGEVCWGMAYRVSATSAGEILAALDHRERQGYERERTTLHLRDSGAIDEVLIYVASAANPHFTGECSEEEIAEVVRKSRGPSGCNVEYVLLLAQALEAMEVEDEHVSTLARLLQPPAGS
jgi:cation transport regulator ChaC